jgi:replicative superfamily II helicase
MMGRAGRPPFDTEGTVVIMTQKANYNRYSTKLELENLESQLFNHMLEHINAEISLGSILSLADVESYFFNSFCYIRMKQSPKTYNIVGNVETFIRNNCLKAIKKLADLSIINFN